MYGLKYKITFVEDISEDAIKQYMEHARLLEEEAIKQAQMMAEEALENSESKPHNGEHKTKENTNAPSEPQEVSVSIENDD